MHLRNHPSHSKMGYAIIPRLQTRNLNEKKNDVVSINVPIN